MRTILNLFLVAVAAALVFAGCSSDDADDDTVSVSATTTQVADLARRVAGDRAEVNGILTESSDPHDYEPRPSDVEGLVDADLLLASGGDVDLWFNDLVESSGSDAPRVDLLGRVYTTSDDPHWWQDPRAAQAAVATIRDELSAVDPEGAAEYEANAKEYINELSILDREVAACIARVPAADRELVTSHDALGPYAGRYGIEVIGAAIPAITTQAQPSAGATAELVELIRARGVTTIFPEAGVSGELEAAIASEAGASVGGELWADALGPPGSDGETYLDAIQSNTTKLVEGFSRGAETCSFSQGQAAGD